MEDKFRGAFHRLICLRANTASSDIFPDDHDRVCLPEVAGNNSFLDCSILDSNARQVGAA